MCGFAGFVEPAGRRAAPLDGIALTMADAIRHRGPDDGGVWCDGEAGVGFGFRRLSILDLSPLGHQPMVSADGRMVVMFNGEIYNYLELRRELEAAGCRFRSQSDTEVLVEGIARWGFRPTIERLNGMFAIAAWDRVTRRLELARDRLGIKPLYWSLAGGLFTFGSELKALKAHPAWRADISRDAVSEFFRYAYIPAPLTIFGDTFKLPAGCTLRVFGNDRPEIECYWDPAAFAAERPVAELDDTEATTELEALLSDSIGRQMLADVPVGAFLSGGIDSSTVVALMQRQTTRPVKSFSIGFRETGYNEAANAKKVAAHLGTDHTELYVEPATAFDVIPTLPHYFDEPFADSSQIPTMLISALARQQVTVALSGDGGDELFAGYNRYVFAARYRGPLETLPAGARRFVGGAIGAVRPGAWDAVLAQLPDRLRPRMIGQKLSKLARLLSGDLDLYRALASAWEHPETVVREAAPGRAGPYVDKLQHLADPVIRMQVADLLTYLPEDILTKVDRASMSVSLEARVPLLDHRVVEFALGLPTRFKIRNGVSKWLLRQVLYRHVPKALVNRPKMGFAIPVDEWLRGPLRGWAESLLNESVIRGQGWLNAEVVRNAWSQHLSGRRNMQQQLWVVLMFQAWLATQ